MLTILNTRYSCIYKSTIIIAEGLVITSLTISDIQFVIIWSEATNCFRKNALRLKMNIVFLKFKIVIKYIFQLTRSQHI